MFSTRISQPNAALNPPIRQNKILGLFRSRGTQRVFLVVLKRERSKIVGLEMPRGNRYYLSGYVWHITHRCHKREFLLKFARDRRRWLQWLGEAKKRFGVSILKYAVTSNHIHLIIRDDKGEEVIPQTMQLIAGRTGQEYNQRKNRKGAFGEDRYQATAVEAESHLSRCME